MNKEVKAKWVAALRSGEYVQGHGQLLTKSGEFCCLGVLCDLHLKMENTNETWQDRDSANLFYMGAGGGLPLVVINWAGLHDSQSVSMGGRTERLSIHNDEGRTFAEIANAIEAQL